VTTIPAVAIWIIIFVSAGSDYYWRVYFMVGWIYLVTCLGLGVIIPYLAQRHWKHHPTLWIFGQGLLAWGVATLALIVLSLTPLCIGQDNGDGVNDLALCMLQTGLVSFVYTPLGFTMLFLTALPGGWLIKQLIKAKLS
jgi:hypothetical protein